MQVETEACVVTTRLSPPVTLLHNNEMCSILLIEVRNEGPHCYAVVKLALTRRRVCISEKLRGKTT